MRSKDAAAAHGLNTKIPRRCVHKPAKIDALHLYTTRCGDLDRRHEPSGIHFAVPWEGRQARAKHLISTAEHHEGKGIGPGSQVANLPGWL